MLSLFIDLVQDSIKECSLNEILIPEGSVFLSLSQIFSKSELIEDSFSELILILGGEYIGFKVVSKSLNPEAKELPLHLMFSVLLDDLASLDMSHIKTLESFPCFEDSDKLRSHHQLPCVDGIAPRLVKSSLELLKDGLLSDIIPPLVDCLE